MFVLVEMVDTVRIPPWNFQKKLNDAITEELNKKLANKVRRCVLVPAAVGGASGAHTVRRCVLLLHRWCTTWAFASAYMTSPSWTTPISSQAMARLTLKVNLL